MFSLGEDVLPLQGSWEVVSGTLLERTLASLLLHGGATNTYCNFRHYCIRHREIKLTKTSFLHARSGCIEEARNQRSKEL